MMKVIEANHERLYDIPGVPGLARRPVDIDAAKTGFGRLRSFRVYRFEAGLTIDGHAEEDEVFVVVTSGSVQIRIGRDESLVEADTHTLSAPDCRGENAAFVAYLPPRAVYELTPLTAADVAYARATPHGSAEPAIFESNSVDAGGGAVMLLDQRTHAERLRLQVRQVATGSSAITLDIPGSDAADAEALVHVQGSSARIGLGSLPGARPDALQSWDTLAFTPHEHATLNVAQGAEVLVLTVFAV